VSTEFFSTVETYSFTREEWADITGLSESAEAKDFAIAFLSKVRTAFAEGGFFHTWEPKPNLDQLAALDDRVEREAATIPIKMATFEAGEVVIAEYITDIGLVEEDEVTLREKPSQLVPIVAGAAAGGATFWFIPGKKMLPKILASIAAGAVVWFSVKK